MGINQSRLLPVKTGGEVNPDQRVLVEVQAPGGGQGRTITKIVRHGDVAHLVSGHARNMNVNFYASLDSRDPCGQIPEKDITTVHRPPRRSVNDHWYLPRR